MTLKNSYLFHNILNYLLILFIVVTTFDPKLGKKVLVITALLWLFTYITKKRLLKLFKIPAFNIGMTFFIFNLISYFWASDLHAYHGYMFDMFFYLIVPILLFSTIPTKQYIPIMIQSFLLIMFINEVISYGILFDFWLKPIKEFPVYFLHHTYYSVLVVIAVLLSFYELTKTNNKYYKVILFVFLVTMIGNLVVSGGRNGQVTLLLSMLILSLQTLHVSIKKALFTISIPIVLFTLAYFVFPQFQDRTNKIVIETKLAFNNQYSNSFGNRLFSYVLAVDFLKEKNIFIGEGAGATHTVKNDLIKQYHPDNIYARPFSHLHQYYINTFFNTGLIGLLLFLIFLYYFYKTPIKDPEVSFAKYTIFSVILISNLADGMLQERPTMLVFALFIGLTFSQYQLEIKDNTNE